MNVAIFPVSDLHRMRPDWSAVDRAEFVTFPPKGAEAPHFHDFGEYLFVLEGSVRILAGREEATIEPGEAALIEPGLRHAVVGAEEQTLALVLRDLPQPPFRAGSLEDQIDRWAGLLPPRRPAASPGRRARTFEVDPAATLAPSAMFEREGDLVLRVNPGDLSEAQAREIRANCDDRGVAIAAIAIAADGAGLPAPDSFALSCINILHPAAIAFEVDPASAEAGTQLADLEGAWLPLLRPRHRGVWMEFRQKDWSREEMMALARFVADLPPAWWGLAMHWSPECFQRRSFLHRAMLAALAPWIRLVCCPQECTDQAAFLLDSVGSQAWLATE